jgi:hypothetical protein
MKRGIIFFNMGNKCIVRMVVSLFSLRQHYSGPITLMTVGPQPDLFIELVKRFNVDIQPLENSENCSHPLVMKAALWKYTPYDTTIFMDADTITLKPIDEYFDMVEKHTFVTGEFAGWRSDAGGTITKRIQHFHKVSSKEDIEAAVKYGPAVNTGIHGYTKDAPILKEWEELTAKGWKAGCSAIPDEIACQVLIPRYPHLVASVDWGVSVKYGVLTENSKIVHYHGRKHASTWALCGIWKTQFWKYMATLNIVEQDFIKETHGDKKFGYYLSTVPTGITAVTAVDEGYLDRLARNFPDWIRTEGVMELPFICFVNGMELDDPRLNFLDGRVRRVKWDFTADSQRERMLSAFVFGAAREVTTDKWVKIDADAFMKFSENGGITFKIPTEFYSGNWVIHGHRWHYTKPGKFLVDLEKWARGVNDLSAKPRIFPEVDWPNIEASKRYGHRRIASYFCVHDSKFVKYAASLAGSKLPVPSHDTYLWYVAAKLGLKIGRTKFKQWIAA